MPLPVSLRTVLEAMSTFDGWSVFLNRRTGELESLSSEAEAMFGADPEEVEAAWERVEGEDWLELPDDPVTEAWSLMERFSLAQEDPDLRDALLAAITGRGAFERFRTAAHARGVLEDWYRYRDADAADVARQWLEAMRIPYVDDLPAGSEPHDDA